MLHCTSEHDRARLKAAVRMVREACRSFMRRALELIKHQEGVQIAQLPSAQLHGILAGNAAFVMAANSE